MEKERKEKKALVTSRVLFYSVLDKIYVVLFGLYFLFGLCAGLVYRNVSSVVTYYISFIIFLAIFALLLNWFYKCITKTMLCITEDEVYIEKYVPLIRQEKSIPLSKITSVTTFKYFYIFRAVIIHQYNNLPTVFWTWNSQEFKDKFDELVDNRKEDIKNDFEDKNVISFINKKYYPIIGGIAGGLVVLFAIIAIVVSLVAGVSVPGTYYSESDDKLILNKDNSCELSGLEVKSCEWKYDKDFNKLTINYTYQTTGIYSREKSEIDEYTVDGKKLKDYLGTVVYTKK